MLVQQQGTKKAIFKKVEIILSHIREVQRWAFQDSKVGRGLEEVIRDPGSFSQAVRSCSAKHPAHDPK